MQPIKKWYKSKTINFNALIVAIVAVLKSLDIYIEPEIIVAIQTIGNIVLRFVTSEPIKERKQ